MIPVAIVSMRRRFYDTKNKFQRAGRLREGIVLASLGVLMWIWGEYWINYTQGLLRKLIKNWLRKNCFNLWLHTKVKSSPQDFVWSILYSMDMIMKERIFGFRDLTALGMWADIDVNFRLFMTTEERKSSLFRGCWKGKEKLFHGYFISCNSWYVSDMEFC